MPVAVAQALRFIIIAVIQSGAFVLLMNVLDPLIDAAKKGVQSTFGLSDDDAMTYVANFVLDVAELAGLTVVALKTRLPLKVADKLGFTSRGFVRGPLPPKVSTGMSAPGAAARNAQVAGTPSKTRMAEAMAAAKGQTFTKVKDVVDIIFKIAAFPVSIGFILTGMIDWAAWNGSAYQGTFQKLFSIVGLNPDADWRKPRTVSEEIFGKVYSTYQLQGAIAIRDPYKMQSVIFSRSALLDLLDRVGAELLAAKGTAPAKDVLAATTALIVFGGKSGSGTSGSIGSGAGGSAGTPSTSVGIAPITKVFTGIVSQGVVGKGLVFTPRPDDLIESADELRQAAANNLAPYLNTLLGKIVYEVKVVSSVISKEGFKLTGKVQKIQTGTFKNGDPKYRTVTNKFAILVVYALTDKGSRAKLTTIVLGPTNAAKLTVAQTDLRELEGELPALVTTTDVGEIDEIATDKDVKVTPKTEEKKKSNSDVPEGYDDDYVTIDDQEELEEYKARGYYITRHPRSINKAAGYPPLKGGGSGSAPEAAPDVSAPVSSAVKPGAGAATLFEWYQAQNQSLPSLEVRAQKYATLGLGQASYYTGTAEQNTKLLNALKAQ